MLFAVKDLCDCVEKGGGEALELLRLLALVELKAKVEVCGQVLSLLEEVERRGLKLEDLKTILADLATHVEDKLEELYLEDPLVKHSLEHLEATAKARRVEEY